MPPCPSFLHSAVLTPSMYKVAIKQVVSSLNASFILRLRSSKFIVALLSLLFASLIKCYAGLVYTGYRRNSRCFYRQNTNPAIGRTFCAIQKDGVFVSSCLLSFRSGEGVSDKIQFDAHRLPVLCCEVEKLFGNQH